MDSLGAGAAAIDPAPTNADEAVEYSLSNGMVARLAQFDVSIAFSSYQSGILYFLGRGPGGAISISPACRSRWGYASTARAG
jgi:hypothetical protein